MPVYIHVINNVAYIRHAKSSFQCKDVYVMYLFLIVLLCLLLVCDNFKFSEKAMLRQLSECNKFNKSHMEWHSLGYIFSIHRADILCWHLSLCVFPQPLISSLPWQNMMELFLWEADICGFSVISRVHFLISGLLRTVSANDRRH